MKAIQYLSLFLLVCLLQCAAGASYSSSTAAEKGTDKEKAVLLEDDTQKMMFFYFDGTWSSKNIALATLMVLAAFTGVSLLVMVLSMTPAPSMGLIVGSTSGFCLSALVFSVLIVYFLRPWAERLNKSFLEYLS